LGDTPVYGAFGQVGLKFVTRKRVKKGMDGTAGKNNLFNTIICSDRGTDSHGSEEFLLCMMEIINSKSQSGH
jgi:hypothetical protein